MFCVRKSKDTQQKGATLCSKCLHLLILTFLICKLGEYQYILTLWLWGLDFANHVEQQLAYRNTLEFLIHVILEAEGN